MLLQALESRADEIITNVMSSLVSYQFAQHSTTEVLADAGVLSAITSYQFPDDCNHQLLAGDGLLSPIASYFYCEWPGDDLLEALDSRQLSYVYPANGEAALDLRGHVTDIGGAPLPGVAVSATWGGFHGGEAVTEANGYYTFPLEAGIYLLTASAPGYGTSSRVLSPGAGTLNQDFQVPRRFQWN